MAWKIGNKIASKIGRKIGSIALNSLPVIAMIMLIPFVQNDYLLAVAYIIICIVAFFLKRDDHDILIFFFGFFAMIVSEYFFVSTGVETFTRNSLLGMMPIWLPILWGYGFVAISRAVRILEK